MTQTVALQRGSTSFSGGGTLTTLFTLSGGTATRVILNSFVIRVTNSSAAWYGGNFVLLWSPSGGTPMPIGAAVNNYGGISAQGLAMLPNSLPVTTFNNSSNSFGYNVPTYPQYSSSFGTSPMQMQQRFNFFQFLPTQVWGGPSDSLQFNSSAQYNTGKSAVYASGTIYWDCVTITES